MSKRTRIKRDLREATIRLHHVLDELNRTPGTTHPGSGRTGSYDYESERLASLFIDDYTIDHPLSESEQDRHTDALATLIQRTIEDYLTTIPS